MKKLLKKLIPTMIWGVTVLICIVAEKLGLVTSQEKLFFWIEISIMTIFSVILIALRLKKDNTIVEKLASLLFYSIGFILIFGIIFVILNIIASWLDTSFFKVFEVAILLESLRKIFQGRD